MTNFKNALICSLVFSFSITVSSCSNSVDQNFSLDAASTYPVREGALVAANLHLIEFKKMHERADAYYGFFEVYSLRDGLSFSGWNHGEGFEVGRPDFVFQWRNNLDNNSWHDEPENAGSFQSPPDTLTINAGDTGALYFMLSPEIEKNSMGAKEYRVCLQKRGVCKLNCVTAL